MPISSKSSEHNHGEASENKYEETYDATIYIRLIQKLIEI